MICFPNFRGAAAGAAETPGGERAALGAAAERLRRFQQLQAKEGRRDTGTERENRCDGLQGKFTLTISSPPNSPLSVSKLEAYSPERFASLEGDLESCRARLSSATSEAAELRQKCSEGDQEKGRLEKELEETNVVSEGEGRMRQWNLWGGTRDAGCGVTETPQAESGLTRDL